MVKKKMPERNCYSSTSINLKVKIQDGKDFSLIATQNQGKSWFCGKGDFSHGQLSLGKNIICFICLKEFIDSGGDLSKLLEAIKGGNLCLNYM